MTTDRRRLLCSTTKLSTSRRVVVKEGVSKHSQGQTFKERFDSLYVKFSSKLHNVLRFNIFNISTTFRRRIKEHGAKICRIFVMSIPDAVF